MGDDRTRKRAVLLDALLAVALAAFGLVSLWFPPSAVALDFREPDALGVVLVVVASFALVLRRVEPFTALALAMAAALGLLWLGYSQTGGGLSALLIVYTLAVEKRALVSAAAAMAAAGSAALALMFGPWQQTVVDSTFNTVVFAIGWVVGRSVRVRRARTAALEARSHALVAAREAENRAGLAEERAVIAREMQDLVAHHLAEITVQLSAAGRLLRRDPGTAERLLSEAEATGRTAMGEMRRILDVLQPTERQDPGPAGLRPLPGLQDLAGFVEAEARAGLPVSLTEEGCPRAVPSGVGLASYRVVEESLALARREAWPKVQVILRWERERMAVQVEDGGSASRAPGDSVGLELLSRRAELYGGRLRYGPRPAGGFAVTAEFPLEEGRVA